MPSIAALELTAFATKLLTAGGLEPTEAAEEAWTAVCEEIANMTLFPKVDSWIFGANIPGKKNAVMFYMAGLSAYRQKLAEVAANGYDGFRMRRQADPVAV